MLSEIEFKIECQKRENSQLDSFIANSIQTLQIANQDRDILSSIFGFDKNQTYYNNIDNSNLKILH